MTAAKFKLLIFSVSGFAFSDVANICIYMILYEFCLLLAQVRCVVISTSIRFVESRVQLADRCASWKITDGAENLVLQAVQTSQSLLWLPDTTVKRAYALYACRPEFQASATLLNIQSVHYFLCQNGA
jgi:hypothetical protein